MLKTLGIITATVAVTSLASAGALNELGDALVGLLEPGGVTLSGMWNGAFGETSKKVEALVCSRTGESCRIEGGRQE